MMAASDLDWQGWLVIATLIIAFIIMGADLVGPDLIFTTLIAFYLACRIVPVSEAGANYGNTGLLTVIFLYMVSEGIYQTGALEGVITHLLGRSRSPFWAIVRLMIPTMVLSAFLNNTPVVALLTPIVISWARRSGVPAKKLLIPLSYAAVLGGTCTLIGTSTNLAVTGQLTKFYKSKIDKDPSYLLKNPAAADALKFKIFDIAPYGVPYAIWGFIFVVIVQRWLLPGNSSRFEQDLLLALRVLYHSPVRGKTLLDSGLKKAYGTHIVALVRKGIWTSDPDPHTVLEENDLIYFAGELDQVEYLGEDLGLQLISNETDADSSVNHDDLSTSTTNAHTKLVQVTLKPDTDLEGVHISQAHLRQRFDVSVIAYGRKKAALGVSRSNSFGRRCGVTNPLAIVNRVPLADVRLGQLVLSSGTTLVLSLGASADTTTADFTKVFANIHDVKEAGTKEFICGYEVVATVGESVLKSGVAGKTASEAGLRGIPGLSLLALDRNGNPEERSEPVKHGHIIQEGDVLWIAADINAVTFLAKFPGLVLTQQKQADKTGVSLLYQSFVLAVVSASGGLVGKSPRELLFRRKYGASVMAIHREGLHKPLHASLALLQPGDVLLLNASEEWCAKHRNDRNFVSIQEVHNSNPPKKSRGLIAITLGIALVVTQIVPGVANAKEWIHIWPCAVLTAALMLLFGCMSANNARASILWDVYLAIAAAFGVSDAMSATNVAYEFAQIFVSIANRVGGRTAALTSIYIATALLSEILTNNAAGAIMLPIAAIAADQLGVEPRAVSIAVMLGASAGFTNPFSYQCNMMVYAAGNYRTAEFARIGAPFQVYLLIVSAFIFAFYDHPWKVWGVSFAVAGALVLFPALYALLPAHTQLAIDNFTSKFTGLFRRKKARHTPEAFPARSGSGGSSEDGSDSKKATAYVQLGAK